MEYLPSHNYQEIRIDTLNEIYTIIQRYNQFYNLSHCDSKNGNTSLQVFYRGQSDSSWNISPSILRSSKKEIEIIKELHPDTERSLFEIISYIQHYHTGTRFIDFTIDPDIAIFFACADNEDKDGAVYLYTYVAHRAEWYSALVLTELTQIEADQLTIQEL